MLGTNFIAISRCGFFGIVGPRATIAAGHGLHLAGRELPEAATGDYGFVILFVANRVNQTNSDKFRQIQAARWPLLSTATIALA